MYTKQGKPKTVIDTNIAVSALIARRGFSAQLFEKIILGEIQNFTSKEIIEEIEDVLKRKEITKRTAKPSRDFILTNYLAKSIEVKPKTKVTIVEDKDDNKFIETALEAKADYIVSGDHHLLELKEFRGIKIVKAKELLELKL